MKNKKIDRIGLAFFIMSYHMHVKCNFEVVSPIKLKSKF